MFIFFLFSLAESTDKIMPQTAETHLVYTCTKYLKTFCKCSNTLPSYYMHILSYMQLTPQVDPTSCDKLLLVIPLMG